MNSVGCALNYITSCVSPANDIAMELRQKILRLYAEHLSPDGLVRV